MINIKEPYVFNNNGKSRCICPIVINGIEKDIWFEVDSVYEEYLVTERVDAYVIGLLHYAMSNNHDIKCEVPVTDELLYNITTILIPSLTKANKDLHTITITADIDKPLSGGKEVGTGCSCGVDSFDAIYMHRNTRYKNLDLTYLCINNVGAFNECYEEYGKEKVKEARYKIADEVAHSLGLQIIKTDSNFAQVIPQNHLQTSTFSSTFAIYMLQKLWKTYYYASDGIDFRCFSLADFSSAHYDLLSLQCFSTSSLHIYSEGGEKTRLEKLQDIADFEPAQQYLHVCIKNPYNCGVCSKCRRTLVALDLLGKLDNFRNVFDIDYYKEHKGEYYSWLAYQHSTGDLMNEPVYQGMIERPEFKKYAIVEKIKKPLRKIKNKLIK